MEMYNSFSAKVKANRRILKKAAMKAVARVVKDEMKKVNEL